MATQLKYMLDPTYWITVEVTGVSKTPGGKVRVIGHYSSQF